MCCPLSDIHSTVVLEYAMWSAARETISSEPVAGRVRGMVVGHGSYKQKILSVTHGRIRGMVVGEDGRSTGVLLYCYVVSGHSFSFCDQLQGSPTTYLVHRHIYIAGEGGSPPQCQTIAEDVFLGTTALHTADVTHSSQSVLSKHYTYWEDQHET